ncbi:glycosyltransferase [Citricoccus sp. K5]|uniref:glycosyltransferase n=1 Tax=Citricoccus sp. K5 TaxID=2653135 RepID=UPI0012F25C63|nr:glycosyltransferase [Citricoccus sp. K5]VXB67205.1 hypothetical protein CITRIK5_60004 [Citricoccus sp. K5]
MGTLAGTVDVSKSVLRIPPMRDKKKWWVDSVKLFDPVATDTPTVVWNPMLGLRSDIHRMNANLHFDLLDDWLVHAAFRSIRPEILRSYGRLFEVASSVSANSEGTLDLARRFGRTDAVLIPNGCDPERFSVESTANGPITVGYIGKMGRRLDAQLIEAVVAAFPDWKFVFAGPVLEKGYIEGVAARDNVELLGDVPYSSIPQLLTSFDIGWVPHDVDHGQVGGDAIKIYEYRASGLPVVTTPIIGTVERPMKGVRVISSADQVESFRSLSENCDRIAREPMMIPADLTWKQKAITILDLMLSS